MSYKTYESYKDSGIEWIGKIPQNWSISRVKNYFAIKSGDSPVKKESGKYEIIGANGCIGVTDDFNITEKHITIGRVGAAGAINITPQKAFVSDNALILDFNKDFIFNYAFYLLKSLNWDSLINKNAQPLITSSQVKNLFIPKIHIDEQLQISKFLDKKTSEIDENIAKNKELISLLEEKKTALINQVVTKGLDPNVPMTDSGIEWIGEIPEHWDVKKLKNILNHITDGSHSSVELVDEGYPYVTVIDLNEEKESVNVENCKRISKEDYDFLVRNGCKPSFGDILFSQIGTVGLVVPVKNFDNYVVLSSIAILTPSNNVEKRWLIHFLKSQMIKNQCKMLMAGGAVKRITLNHIANFSIISPPKTEQKEIYLKLDENSSKINKIINKIQENIDLLEEYKTSLIHHAVTGKIDVRDEI